MDTSVLLVVKPHQRDACHGEAGPARQPSDRRSSVRSRRDPCPKRADALRSPLGRSPAAPLSGAQLRRLTFLLGPHKVLRRGVTAARCTIRFTHFPTVRHDVLRVRHVLLCMHVCLLSRERSPWRSVAREHGMTSI